MSNKIRSIIVQNVFGRDAEMNKPDFVRKWRVSVTDLHDITTTRADDIEIVNIIENVESMASRRFEEIYKKQGK